MNAFCMAFVYVLCAQLRDQHIKSLKAMLEADDMHASNRNNDDQVFYALAFALSRDVFYCAQIISNLREWRDQLLQAYKDQV